MPEISYETYLTTVCAEIIMKENGKSHEYIMRMKLRILDSGDKENGISDRYFKAMRKGCEEGTLIPHQGMEFLRDYLKIIK